MGGLDLSFCVRVWFSNERLVVKDSEEEEETSYSVLIIIIIK